jgi:TolB-like protein/class 3 adenylate cyclase
LAREQRRLAAIVAADVVGYSRLMGRDESGTLAHLQEHRTRRLEPTLARHGGRLVKLTGDGALIEFPSAVDALSAAIEFQQAMAEANRDQPADTAIVFRIGLHLGDLIVEGDDLYGDGVNVASRLEAEAPPGGIIVSRAVREAVQGRLKAKLHALGELTLKNIERPIRAFRVEWNEADWRAQATPTAKSSGPASPLAPPLALPDKPSIAVLPFQNMSGDPEQEYFVDGMGEEIITALSRIRWLFVLARNSSFTYKGQAVDVKQVGRELGVRYVLEGSVRKGGNRVRITGQLIDAETGAHLWADHFDGVLEDVFDLQDRVASSVAGVIEPALQAAETVRSASRATANLTAYDLYLRAYAMFLSSSRRIPEALCLMERAIQCDPRYGPALAWAAVCCHRLLLDSRSEDREADRMKGADFARRALEVAGEDPGILANAAFALAYFGEDIGAMIALLDRALKLNPNFARGWHLSGTLRTYAGQLDIAIEHIEVALRLSPRARMGPSITNIGAAHFLSRRFDEALPKLLVAIQDDPSYPQPYRYLAACNAHMGRTEDAREAIKRLRAITPHVFPDVSYLRNAEHRELFLSGLRMAVGENP